MMKLFCHEVSNKIRYLLLVGCVFSVEFLKAQQSTTVLPNDASLSNKLAPQGALRYQRGFYLVKPDEMNRSGITAGMSINSIGFTIGRAQKDTTKGQFKAYLQNTTDLVSRADTGWNTFTTTTNEYNALSLLSGRYEWQVKANCSVSMGFTPSVFFNNDDLSGCNNPYNLNAISVATTTATLTWEAAGSPVFTQYSVEYKALDVVNWTSANTTDTFYNLSGLVAGKAYQWRVKTVCSTGYSAINYSNFTTNKATGCNALSGLNAAVTYDSIVRLTWTADTTASFYEVQFRRTGTEPWSNSISFADSAKLILPKGTSYQWQVRINCGASSTGPFTTATFSTGGTPVCYDPINPTTRQISATSAKLSWTPVVGANSYSVRYRLKNTISWANAITPMTLACDSLITIPDTTGAYDINFNGGTPFTYNGAAVYIAWEYSRLSGNLTTTNLSLSTSQGTSIQGTNGQDSISYLLCMVSKSDTSLAGLPTILAESKLRPETRLGSSGLKDSASIVAVYALGMTAPKFQSPTPIAALVSNNSSTNKTYPVTLTVKQKLSSLVRYTATQNVAVTAGDTVQVSFNGWSPSVLEQDSIIISIPTQTNENVVNNNSKGYVQEVNTSIIAYDDGSPLVIQAGYGTAPGLLLNKHSLQGCGQVISAKVYLTESAEGQPLYAVVRNTTGTIIAQSPSFTAGAGDINKYHSFYFINPASLLNEDFFIGIAQLASTTPSYPVGAQWEDAQTRSGAYYRANVDGSNLTDYPAGGRLMIKAELTSSTTEPLISGNLVLCSGGSNVLTAGGFNTRYANKVLDYSSQNAPNDYSANQALGSPNVYPTYALSPNSWVSATAQDRREYIVLGFPNPGKINFVDIYETANPGAIDSIFVKNPTSNTFQLVYSTTATTAPFTARKNHISFTETSFDVSEIRIAVNSPAVPGYNAIDAVGIGRDFIPAVFNSYIWSPGNETTQTKTVITAGVYNLTVTNVSGCQSSTSVTVVNAVATAPVITAAGPISFCSGDSVKLTSSITSGILWSTGATTPSITVKIAGPYSVTYNGGNCGSLTSAPITISINSIPTVSINGLLDICLGNQNELDAGAGYSSYLWNTGQTSQKILIASPGIYSVKITNATGCTNTASVTAVYATLPSPSITGNVSFCPGGSTVLDAGAGYSSYLWSTGATSRTITVTVAGTYNVNVTNAGGCSASASIVTMLFVKPIPVIAGNAGFCSGSSTTLTAGAGYNNYIWSTGSTVPSVTLNTAGIYNLSVTDNNGCSGDASITIVQFSNPAPVIAGTLSFCGGTNTTLNAGTGFSSYLWNTGATSQTINVNTVGTFSVTVLNSNGCSASASATTTNTGSLPAVPGVISGPATASCSTTGNVYSITAVPNASHYVWTVPSGATIVSGQRTTSISVNFNASFQGGDIIIAASNACGQSPSIIPRKLAVQSLANAPGVITGQVSAICGPTTKTYSIAAVSMATSYTWSVPAGAAIVSGQNSTSVNVSFIAGFTYGNICVTANNLCGSSVSSCTLLSGTPPTPGTIRGATTVCKNEANIMYEIDPVAGATSYTWTVPQSATISGGQGTKNIVVKVGPNSGNITVKANSACGTSGIKTLAVTVNDCPNAVAVVRQSFTMPEKRAVPEIVSSYGGYGNAGNNYFEWTLGEPVIQTVVKSDYLYSQGFHQPIIKIVSIKQPNKVNLISSDKIKILVYPNPVSTLLKVNIETPKATLLVLELVDVNSRLLQRTYTTSGLNKSITQFQMTQYSEGTYYLIVKDINGKMIETIKVIKLRS